MEHRARFPNWARCSSGAGALAVAVALGGCSLAPAYHPPVTAIPAAYKELPPGWAAANPGDAQPRGNWWALFADPELDRLERRIEQDSPALAAALARYDRARAAAQEAGADLYPQLAVGADAERERISGRRPLGLAPATYDDLTIGGSLDYEIDLWGRVRNAVRAGRADAEASAADLASVRLSLQASLADAFFRLRGLDAEAALLNDTVVAYGRALDLTNTRHEGGIASGLDVSRAQTILSNARAQISATANERAATEHEIAALVGEVASTFSIAPARETLAYPQVPLDTPSGLLQRRPDIAAAERRIAAANARIGVARAAMFPSLTLGGAGGFEATHGSLLSSPASFWALGPLSVALSIFDGGRRAAEVRISRADYDEAAADYRTTVLTAFREVEDSLAAARTLAVQAGDQETAATAAGRTRDLALVRYRDGASDYLEVVTAQTAALDAERAAIAIQTARMRAAVSIIRAMGGAGQDGAQAASASHPAG